MPRLLRRPVGLRLALPLCLRLGDREPDPPERLVERKHVLGVCLLDGERPDFRSPQRDTVATERIGDRPHVRAGADTEIESRDAIVIGDDVERVDLRAPQGHLDHNALPMQLVGALASDLDGGRRWDRKLDLAPEGLERGLELRGGRRLVRVEGLALGIARRRPSREVDIREVALRQSDKA